MTKKKPVKPKATKSVWVLIKNDTLYSTHLTFPEAVDQAETEMEKDESADIKILEVVGAWEMVWPEEPMPEVCKVGLDTL